VCVLLEFLQKNIGDPYYEPTIMVHDNIILNENRLGAVKKGTAKQNRINVRTRTDIKLWPNEWSIILFVSSYSYIIKLE